jgi:hypothetical protein
MSDNLQSLPATQLVVNHVVVAAQSPRLLYSATLGIAAMVAAALHVKGTMNSTDDDDSGQSDPGRCTRGGLATTPLGLGNSPPSFPG